MAFSGLMDLCLCNESSETYFSHFYKKPFRNMMKEIEWEMKNEISCANSVDVLRTKKLIVDESVLLLIYEFLLDE